MSGKHPRLEREDKTVEAMIRLYCSRLHRAKKNLCPECEGLLSYARASLDRCPFQEGKTTCAKCPVHCYKPDMREKAREVMRYSGPRMVYRHPILAIYHLFDKLRKEPVKQGDQ
ncbi:nitrous oxide-stimulated promoter family protein [Thermodesulfobacteriota bacterium]